MIPISRSTRAPLRVKALQWATTLAGWEFSVAAVPQGVCGVGLPGRHDWLHFWTEQQLIVDPTGASGAQSRASEHLKAAQRWLEAYGTGTREELPMLVLVGTDFQRRVWKALLAIPRGKTWSYRDVAKAVGVPRAYRAVGQAVGANPLALLIPCHRVIGSSGKLIGFGAGLQLKKELLDHEN